MSTVVVNLVLKFSFAKLFLLISETSSNLLLSLRESRVHSNKSVVTSKSCTESFTCLRIRVVKDDISQASLLRILIFCFIRALKIMRTANPSKINKIKQRTIKIHICATPKPSFCIARLISVLFSTSKIETLAVVVVFLGQQRGGRN